MIVREFEEQLKCRQNSGECGFSLIEILVATFLLAISIVGMLEGLTQSLRSTASSELHTQAVFLASGVMEELRVETIREGSFDGDFERFPEMRYSALIEEQEIPGLFQVSIQIFKKIKNQTSLSVNTKSSKSIKADIVLYSLVSQIFSAGISLNSTDGFSESETDLDFERTREGRR